MGNTIVIRLNKRGGLTLPPELRRELLPGTEFVVRRQDRNILLLPKQTPGPHDLSAAAGSFANALVSQGYADYTVQMALQNAHSEQVDELWRGLPPCPGAKRSTWQSSPLTKKSPLQLDRNCDPANE